MSSIPSNLLMMRLQGHKKFLSLLASEPPGDIRAQSNSFGVDGFVQRHRRYRSRIEKDLGLSLSCNLTCYFGCFFAMLFRPTEEFDKLVSGVRARLGHDGSNGKRQPTIGVQVRIGGAWAVGFRIGEPFRTPPSAIRHFFHLIDELRDGKRGTPSSLQHAILFVSSDAPRFINMTRERYGDAYVVAVDGDAFGHTDTFNLGDAFPGKYAKLEASSAVLAYARTLACHFFVGECDHVVMAQSGFGDTAFWRGRRTASAIFVDMNNNKLAWQHHLQYGDSNAECGSAPCGHPARSVKNRIIDIRKNATSFYEAVP